MSDLMQRQLDDLGKMTTSDLVQRYEDLHGHKCRTRHRAYLIRKIAWRIQANAEGGLSERARKRAAELADLAEVRVMAPKAAICPPQPGPGCTTTRSVKGMVTGDARIPPAGFAVVKEYKGRVIRVVVLPDGQGFDYEGERYRSLSAIAKKVTGTHVNGFRFFGLQGKS